MAQRGRPRVPREVPFTDLHRDGMRWAQSLPDRTPEPGILLAGCRSWGEAEAHFEPGDKCPVCHNDLHGADHYCLVCNDWGRLRGQHPAQAPPGESSDDGLAGGVGRKLARLARRTA